MVSGETDGSLILVYLNQNSDSPYAPMLDYEKKKTNMEKVLADAEEVNPNGNDHAHGHRDGRHGTRTRVPITDDSCGRRQFS